MALDRSSAVELLASGTSMDLTTEKKHGPTSPDVPSKKKKFTPLKSLKRFFAVNKKKKMKEEVTGVGMKSTSCDVLETPPEEGNSQLPSKTTISMSADSVFSGDRQRDDDMEFTRSMEALPGSHFKDELAHKLQGLRSDDDEGLPSSPPAHTTTVDALIESGLKEKSISMESEHSWMSLDSSETELDDLFGKDWAANGGYTSASSYPDDVDLDIVTSTTSLNMTAAKHKIAVKPKVRSSAIMQRRRMASPMATASVVILPKVKEEPQTVESNPVTAEDEDKNVNTSQDEKPTSEKCTTDESTEDLTSEKEEADTRQALMDVSDRTGVSSEEEELKDSSTETNNRENIKKTVEKPASLVIRRNKHSPASNDSAKRLTIAGDSIEMTHFGEQRVKRSSLLIEEKVEHTEESSEFASVFARFKKQASQKRADLDKMASLLEQSQQHRLSQKAPLFKNTSNVDSAKSETVAQNKPKASKQQSLPTEARTKFKLEKDVKKEAVIIEKSEIRKVKSEKVEHVTQSKPQVIIVEKSKEEEMNVAIPSQIKKNGKREKTNICSDVKSPSSESIDKVSSRESLSDFNKKVKTTSAEEHSKKGDNTSHVSIKEPSVDSGSKAALSKTAALSSKYVGFHQKSVSDVSEVKPEEKPKSSSKKVHTLENEVKENKINKEVKSSDDKCSISSARDSVTSSVSSTTHRGHSPSVINQLQNDTSAKSLAAKDLSHTSDSLQGKLDASVNKENIPSAASQASPRRASIIRSAGSGRPTPQKLVTGSKPSWIEVARKRTEGWGDEDKDKETDDKKTTAETELAEKRASVFDLVKRFQ